MPSSNHSGSDHAGVQKRMRKGTKSCLPCRKRKIRCSGNGPKNDSCPECKSRGVQCVAQGIISVDDAEENARLKAYIEELESRLEENKSMPTRERSTLPTKPSNSDGATQQSIEDLLANVRDSRDTREVSQGQNLVYDQPEEDLGSAGAPLVRLLNNPTLGTTFQPSQDEKTGRVLENHRQGKCHLSQTSPEHLDAVRELCAHLPPNDELNDILDNQSSWWSLYRDTLGLVWGEEDCQSLRMFAMQALSSKHPSLLGILLTSLAVSTGNLQRYLPPVERRIVNVDEYAGCEYGLGCLMALGLCYIGSLQPRRAWTIYRRAIALLQLNGLHVRRKSEKHELLFWQLFHADRWVSLMIGLPHCISDKVCNVTIPSIETLGPGTWLYRRIGLLTGQVIDCLQNVKGPTLAAVFEIEQQMDEMKSQLPNGYLDMDEIRTCTDLTDKLTRLYRVVHFHQLRAHIHLPFLLRSATQERYKFSRESCIDDSRRLLEAYLEIFDTDPSAATYGTVLNFTAFVAAIVVLMDVACYRSFDTSLSAARTRAESDWRMLYRVMDAIKHGGTTNAAGLICRKCYAALEQLVSSAQSTDVSEPPKRVVLPYFGTLLITKPPTKQSPSQPIEEQSNQMPTSTPQENWQIGHDTQVTSQQNMPFNVSMDGLAMSSDFSMYPNPNSTPGVMFAYNGPFLPEGDPAGYGSLPVAGSSWFNDFDMGTDWSWLTADLPPNVAI